MSESDRNQIVSRDMIVAAILASSPLTRLALASQNDQLRERAAGDIADDIQDRLAGAAQLPLAL